MFNEKFDPHLSEIGHVCEPLLDARFFKKLHKLFLGCLRKWNEYVLNISHPMEYLLRMLMLLRIYDRKIFLKCVMNYVHEVSTMLKQVHT